MTQPGPKRIHGRKLLEVLAEAGVISQGDFIRRVIIDAAVDRAVMIYVERFGDERVLSIALDMVKDGGYVIKYAPRKPSEEKT